MFQVKALALPPRTKISLLSLFLALATGASLALLALTTPEISRSALGIVGAGLGAVLFLVLCLVKPYLGLAAGLGVLYNPWFNYAYLYTRGWRGGATLAAITASIVLLLSAALIVRAARGAKLERFPTPWDKPLLLFSLFPLIGLAHGFYRGNQPREILAELFPFAAFYAFFFLTPLALKSRREIKRVLLILSLWLSLSSLIGLILYFTRGYNFAFYILVAGGLIPRLSDFLPALLLPFAVAFLLTLKSRWYIAYLPAALFIAVLILSYFRSLWLGVIAAITFLLVLTKPSAVKAVRFLGLLLLAGMIIFLLDAVVSYYSLYPNQATVSQSLGERGEQTFVLEGPLSNSTVGRWLAYRSLIDEIWRSPLLGKGLGGTFQHYAGWTAFLSSAPNYYLSLGAQLGLPALLAFTALMLLFFREGLRRLGSQQDSAHKALVLGILAGFVSIGVVLLTFPSLLHYPLAAYLGTGAALLFIPYEISSDNKGISAEFYKSDKESKEAV